MTIHDKCKAKLAINDLFSMLFEARQTALGCRHCKDVSQCEDGKSIEELTDAIDKIIFHKKYDDDQWE